MYNMEKWGYSVEDTGLDRNGNKVLYILPTGNSAEFSAVARIKNTFDGVEMVNCKVVDPNLDEFDVECIVIQYLRLVYKDPSIHYALKY